MDNKCETNKCETKNCISCEASNCIYHTCDGKCSAGCIEVGNKNAEKPTDTCCDTFKAR